MASKPLRCPGLTDEPLARLQTVAETQDPDRFVANVLREVRRYQDSTMPARNVTYTRERWSLWMEDEELK